MSLTAQGLTNMPFPRTLALICLHLIFVQSVHAQDALPPLAPERQQTQSQNAEIQAPDDEPDKIQPVPASVVLPPHVPPRTIPTSTSLPLVSANANAVKPSLAWRAKAQQLRQSTTAINRRLSGTYDSMLMALITRLPQFGYHVETLNSKAGEVLAAPADPSSRQRIILVISEMPAGSVTIKAMPLIQGKQTNEVIQQLLLSVSMDNEHRGTL